MRRSIILIRQLTGLLTMGLLLLPETLLRVLTNAVYLGAAPALQVLGLSMMFFGLARLFMD